MMAIAAGAEFQRRGYKIPEDIIITGFDGSEEANFALLCLQQAAVAMMIPLKPSLML